MKFEGPSCIKLLESVNAFYNKNGEPKIIEMIPYLNALKSFNEVRKVCFICAEPGDIDVDECKEKIEKFTSDSLVLIEDLALVYFSGPKGSTKVHKKQNLLL